jgi:hypothetical protein
MSMHAKTKQSPGFPSTGSSAKAVHVLEGVVNLLHPCLLPGLGCRNWSAVCSNSKMSVVREGGGGDVGGGGHSPAGARTPSVRHTRGSVKHACMARLHRGARRRHTAAPGAATASRTRHASKP